MIIEPRGVYGKGPYCCTVWGTEERPVRLEPGVSIPCTEAPETAENIDWTLTTLWYLIQCESMEHAIEICHDMLGSVNLIRKGGLNSWEGTGNVKAPPIQQQEA